MIRRRMVKKMSRMTFDKDKLDKHEIKTKCIGIKITKKKPKK